VALSSYPKHPLSLEGEGQGEGRRQYFHIRWGARNEGFLVSSPAVSRLSDQQRAIRDAQRLYQERSFSLFSLLAGAATVQAQQAYLEGCLQAVGPLLVLHKLTMPFSLRPGPRLRSRYGQCRRFPGGRVPEIQVRCTRAGVSGQWRQPGALAGTLLHELAHLRYPHHRPRFWTLCCRLLDDAAEAGLYDPLTDDPSERAQGDTKLAGSAAQLIAESARRAEREVRARNRRAIEAWEVGHKGVITGTRGRLSGAVVTVLAKLRTRLEVRAPDGRRYLVPAAMLGPFDAGAAT
jgi:hypothetical protein